METEIKLQARQFRDLSQQNDIIAVFETVPFLPLVDSRAWAHRITARLRSKIGTVPFLTRDGAFSDS